MQILIHAQQVVGYRVAGVIAVTSCTLHMDRRICLLQAGTLQSGTQISLA